VSGRTVIDITYLAHWPGRLTGIPRVVSEFTSRSVDRPDTVFVVWDARFRRFEAVDPAATVAQHGRGVQHLTRTSRGLAIAKRLKWGGTGMLSRRLGALSEALGGRRGAFRARELATRAAELRAAEHVVVEPGAGDTVLSFMGEWHDQAYIDALRSAHGRGALIVQVVYDLLPIVTPHTSGHSTVTQLSYLRQIMPVTALALAISRNTRDDLEAWCRREGIAVPRIEVFRLGDDFTAGSTDADDRGTVPAGIGDRPYMLCVGTVEARKNHTLLYYAYRRGIATGRALPELVVVGRPGFRAGDVYEILREDPALVGRVHVLSDIDDAGLAWLYRHARFTVYPSVYEGWGLPIAESLAYGRPVLASGTSSMPEIAGELIDYFDPFSAEQLLDLVEAMMDDQRLAEAEARLARYRPTPWSETVDAIDELIRSATSA
jgi:glycosyltransferase involved in cell wall biosynthesis